jgi:hypothetical protein
MNKIIKWEYHTETVPSLGDPLLCTLNTCGHYGWELVQMIDLKTSWKLIFKKPLEE